MGNRHEPHRPASSLCIENGCNTQETSTRITVDEKGTTAEVRELDETSIPEPSTSDIFGQEARDPDKDRVHPTESTPAKTTPSSGGNTSTEGDPCEVRATVLAPNTGIVGAPSGQGASIHDITRLAGEPSSSPDNEPIEWVSPDVSECQEPSRPRTPQDTDPPKQSPICISLQEGNNA